MRIRRGRATATEDRRSPGGHWETRKPERIVSITLFTDEILLDLVDTSRLVAVTTFTADADISNVAGRVADISNKVSLAMDILAPKGFAARSSWAAAMGGTGGLP